MELRVLIMKRENGWVAQCLEYDIVAQSQGTIYDIKDELMRTLHVRLAACQAEGINPFKLQPAPQLYHDLFERAQLELIDDDRISLPPAFMINGFRSEIRCQL